MRKGEIKCLACGSHEHHTGGCQERSLTVEVTPAELLCLHMQRKYGGQTKAAIALKLHQSTLSAALHGTKQVPIALLEDAGLTVSMEKKA